LRAHDSRRLVKIPKGTTSDHACGFQDILTTLADVSGKKLKKGFNTEGGSFYFSHKLKRQKLKQ
jgi:hypothetical protein